MPHRIVRLDLFRLVQVERSGEPLAVHDRRLGCAPGRGELEDGERPAGQDFPVQDDLQRRRLRQAPGEQRLPAQPDRHAALDVGRRQVRVARPEHLGGVGRRLEQTGDQLGLVCTKAGRRAFRPDVQLEPFRHRVAVGMPPAFRLGLLGQNP